ncbi:MAG: SDR family NAD(P)-dependent oxidoreductase [Rhodobacterales bacterium]|nr:SDR family NAD(P)-dependent oxidoreductase [Rhodobacterales bacterium]
MSGGHALVTGGAKRVGRAICLELARSGFDVAVHYRSSGEGAEATAQACRDLGARAWTVRADLAEPSQVLAMVEAVKSRWDRLELLVNNASLFYATPFDQIDDADWARMMQVNLTAPFVLCRELLPLLRNGDPQALSAPEGQHGVVVHLCDIGAERPVRGHTHYSVSKAGLVMLMRSMAVELAPAIRTVGVSPGQVVWPPDYTEEKRKRLALRIPMGRVGTAQDIATLVRYVALEGHYLNGIILPVDGGLACRY